jgi:ABC-type polysaccharide/polyol phosphate export systems, permease component
MRLKENYIAFETIVRKEVVRVLRIWLQTVLPSGITMFLYIVIFGGLIGARIGSMEGISYMEFIVPGLIMMSVITNAYSNVVSSFFSAKFQRSIEELMVSPLSSTVIVGGYIAGGVIRGLLVALLVTIIALFFTRLQIHNVAIVFSIVILTAVLFSLGGFLNALFAKKFDDIAVVPTFVLTPLTYLGGVFYSIKMLPDFWQSISLVNPILYLVNAFRYGFLGVSDIDIYHAFGVLIVFIAVLFALNVHLINRGIGLRS